MTPSNIHVGAGTLTLNPDTTPIVFDSSNDGATLTYSAELEPIAIDQVLSPVGYFVPGEECKFETIVPEADATTLRYALGATDQTVSTQVADATKKGYSQIAFGGNYLLTNYVLEYKAKRRNALNLFVVIRLYIVNISPNVELVYKKDGVSFYKLTFMAVADTSKDAGEQLGYYRYETADLTGTTPTLAVTTTDPADGAGAVAVADVIDITFNRDVKPESVINGNFILMDVAGDLIASNVAYTGTGGTKVTVTPTANMAGATVHFLAISANVRTADDNTPMTDDKVINFTTA
jgi:hypothetical protein